MTTFREAREVVEERYGRTRSLGWEDGDDFLVRLEEDLEDVVVLVRKSNGVAREEVYFDVEEKLNKMTEVRS